MAYMIRVLAFDILRLVYGSTRRGQMCTHHALSTGQPALHKVFSHCTRGIMKNNFINFFKVCTGGEQDQVVHYENQKIFKKIKFSFPEYEDRHEVSRHYEHSNICENFVLKKNKNYTSDECCNDRREG